MARKKKTEKEKQMARFKFGGPRKFEGYRYEHSSNHRTKSGAKYAAKQARKDKWSRVVKRGDNWAVYTRNKGW